MVFREKRMASYILRSKKLIEDGNTKGAMDLVCDGIEYYTKRAVKAISPYTTADAALLVTALRYVATGIEENNDGVKEMAEWLDENLIKPDFKKVFQETTKTKKPNLF